MRQMAVGARDGMGEGGAGSEKNTRMHRKQCIFAPFCTLLVSFKWVGMGPFLFPRALFQALAVFFPSGPL